jgi:hypothetical protein
LSLCSGVIRLALTSEPKTAFIGYMATDSGKLPEVEAPQRVVYGEDRSGVRWPHVVLAVAGRELPWEPVLSAYR